MSLQLKIPGGNFERSNFPASWVLGRIACFLDLMRGNHTVDDAQHPPHDSGLGGEQKTQWKGPSRLLGSTISRQYGLGKKSQIDHRYDFASQGSLKKTVSQLIGILPQIHATTSVRNKGLCLVEFNSIIIKPSKNPSIFEMLL